MSIARGPLPVLSFGSALKSPLDEDEVPGFGKTCEDMEIDSEGDGCEDDPRPPIDMAHLANSVLKAKRIVVVTGAGISVASGIPDFRSVGGLFQTLKEKHPEVKLSSGKDLFDYNLFKDGDKTACYYTMIDELKTMTDNADPTAFHYWLKQLDLDGKLHRVYTQNIDCLEQRAGLSFGLGNKDIPIPKRGPPSPKKRRSPRASTSNSPQPTDSYPTPASSYTGTPSPPPELVPKCIPLHGHLATLSCDKCSKTVSLDQAASAHLATEGPMPCPECCVREQLRRDAGQRPRGAGYLMPDIVLYNTTHPDADRIGEITQRDMLGARPDLVLVVGTSLKVPGTVKIVKELSKVAHPAVRMGGVKTEDDGFPSASQQSTTSSSGRSRKLKPAPVHVVYLNNEFPSPQSQWRGVFDVWARGDIQEFVAEVAKYKPAHDEAVAKRAREKEARDARMTKATALMEKENERARAAGRPVQTKLTMARVKAILGEVAAPVVKVTPAAAKPRSVVVDLPSVKGKVKSSATVAARSSRRSSVAPPARQPLVESMTMTRSRSQQSMMTFGTTTKPGLAAGKK